MAVGKGSRLWGTSCSDTIHFKSADVIFFLEATFSSKERATCSAEIGELLISKDEVSSVTPEETKSIFSAVFCVLLHSGLGDSALEL